MVEQVPASASRYDPFGLLPRAARTKLGTSMDRARAIRNASRSGFEAISDQLLAGAHAPKGTWSATTTLPGLDPAIADLLGAVEAAQRLASGVSERDELAAMRSVAAWSDSMRAPAVQVQPGGEATKPVAPLRAFDQSLVPAAVRRAARYAETGYRLIAAALDRDLPRLPRPARVRAAATGCDVVDQTPLLCVGGPGDNTYTAHSMLSIDLGGNDTYLNDAGGAPSNLDPGEALQMVSVAVDLAGDDRYECGGTTVPSPSGFVGGKMLACQGGAGYGAIGLLVDLLGDDVYTATNPGAPRSTLIAQGASVVGVGGLFDFSGNDRYIARAWDDGTHGMNTQYLVVQGASQGVAAGPGLGMLVDLGLGSDAYRVDGGAIRQECAFPCDERRGQRYVIAHGSGCAATGALVDDGGTDEFGVAAYGSWPTDTPIWDWRGGTVYLPVVWIQAQGGSFLGDGYLVEGAGDTRYEIDVRSDGTVWPTVIAQGASMVGTALLDDGGGADSYSVRVRSETARTLASLSCDSKPCRFEIAPNPSDVGIGFVPTWLDATVLAQGASGWLPGGFGVLDDAAGNDRYVASNTVSLDVHASTSDDEVGVAAIAAGYPTSLIVQGAADSVGTGGILVDGAGSNDYRASFDNELAADGSGAAVTAEIRNRTGVAAQGGIACCAGNVGALFDLGMGPSSFDAAANVHAETRPDPASARTHSWPWPAFQGSSYLGSGIFFTSARSARIVSHPSQVVCAPLGARGFVAWNECGTQDDATSSFVTSQGVDSYLGGVGSAPNSGPGRGVHLAVDDASPRGDAWMDVPASLTDGMGRAIPDAVVHLDVQMSAANVGWRSLFTQDVQTGVDGRATGTLPLQDLDSEYPFDGSARLRVFATYDGDGNARPAHATRAVPNVAE